MVTQTERNRAVELPVKVSVFEGSLRGIPIAASASRIEIVAIPDGWVEI